MEQSAIWSLMPATPARRWMGLCLENCSLSYSTLLLTIALIDSTCRALDS